MDLVSPSNASDEPLNKVNDDVETNDVVWLIRLAGSVSSSAEPLADRRQRVLEQVGRRIRADGGWWIWGQGHPLPGSKIIPLAQILWNYSLEQMAKFNEGALSVNVIERFQKVVIAKLSPEHPQSTDSVDQTIGEEIWFSLPEYKRCFEPMGGSRFVNSVRYFANNYWVACVYGRSVGSATFSANEIQIVDRMMAGITTMHVTPDKAIPAEVMRSITDRQSQVLLQLLDGQSRRSIAYRLAISEHTVNEHVKALFKHFGVGSVSELSAQFLRSRN